jgi:hypothetical protein
VEGRTPGSGPTVGPLAAVNAETFRRAEIKHVVRRKSFRAMRNFHAMRSFHVVAASDTAPPREPNARGDSGPRGPLNCRHAPAPGVMTRDQACASPTRTAAKPHKRASPPRATTTQPGMRQPYQSSSQATQTRQPTESNDHATRPPRQPPQSNSQATQTRQPSESNDRATRPRVSRPEEPRLSPFRALGRGRGAAG